MIVEQQKWSKSGGWQAAGKQKGAKKVSKGLVLSFGNRFELENEERYRELAEMYPNSDIITCSTSGEILDIEVTDAIVSTAIEFEKTDYRIIQVNVLKLGNSYEAGKVIAKSFKPQGLRHVFIISDGSFVNGSELVQGLNDYLPKDVSSTGGLAGDGARFEKTLVGLNSPPGTGKIVGVGFYGESLKIGYGSVGGWDPFGPERVVTKSEKNVLYKLDDKSALDLYKSYLGEKANELPGSALLFPLSIKLEQNAKPLVRTILSVDEEHQSMVFAGDMPEGSKVRMMKANFDKLVDGAFQATDAGMLTIGKSEVDLALLVSCVGRKLVLDQRVEEEVESVVEVVGNNAVITGFYSYGEIAPFSGLLNCELHNQTMTVTLFREE